MKRFASAIAFLLVAAAVPVLAQTWISGPFDGALAAAKKENKPILVDFTQKGG
jgi:hypothetical protein